MSEQLRDNYFLAVKIIMLIALELYIALTKNVLTGASGMVLLLLALLIGCFSLVQLFDKLRRWMCLCGCIILLIVITTNIEKAFVLLGICLVYDIISYLKPSFIWYFTPLIFGIIESDINSYVRILACLFIGIIYIQHDFIVESYRKQTKEDTIAEQKLKHNMNLREHEMREELRKSFLMAQLAYHISTGTPIWNYKVNKGTVLYLALEDDYSRLQKRLYQMFGTDSADNLYLSVSASQLNEGLDKQLESFITKHADTKLIIIDTLQKVREVSSDYSYSNDYEIISSLKKICRQ